MKFVFSVSVLAAAILLGLTGLSHSAPVVYDESIGGDLSALSPWVDFTLDVGLNSVTIHGQAITDSASFLYKDFDSFGFTVPVGMELSSIGVNIQVTNVVNPGFVWIEHFLDLGPSPYSVVTTEVMQINPVVVGTGSLLTSGVTLGSGSYLLYQGQMGAGFNTDVSWTMVWTMNVVPVPEPSTVSLFVLTGAVGVVAFARKRFHRA